jgi:putative sterol carrier protein
MKPEIFTDAWARAWGEELRASESYRSAAGGWEGAIALTLEGNGDPGALQDRSVLLDLWHGECRDARAAEPSDLERAPFLLRAPAAVWKRVLEGDLDPLLAVMSGKLELARGSVASLVPYSRASKELVLAARRIDATFPEGWEAPEP